MKERINISEGLSAFRSSWAGKTLAGLCIKMLKKWYLLITFLLLGLIVGYLAWGTTTPHYETRVFFKTRTLSDKGTLFLIDEYLKYDQTEFIKRTGLSLEDYTRLKDIREIKQIYRHDWSDIIPHFNKSANKHLASQFLDVFVLKSPSPLDERHLKALQGLFENMKEIKQLKAIQNQHLNAQLKHLNAELGSVSSLNYEALWPIKKAIFDLKFELSLSTNVVFSHISPSELHAEMPHHYLFWGATVFLIFGIILIGYLKN